MRYLFILLVAVCSSCAAEKAPACPAILTYIQKKLPHSGVLGNSEGFVYVKVDDQYIHKLVTFIQEEGFEEPPYFGRPGLVGAHISVVYAEEMKRYKVGEIQEYGETIHFTPKACKVVHPPNWPGREGVYVIVVEAPELERIREKYGLPKQEFAFHITIGVKSKAAKAA
jgi:hypothetical protein